MSTIVKQGLFNILDGDFTATWLDDDNNPHELTIPSQEIKYFNKPQYLFMRKHLADAVFNTRNGVKNSAAEYKKILEEIMVAL